jgi:hypothetical protein
VAVRIDPLACDVERGGERIERGDREPQVSHGHQHAGLRLGWRGVARRGKKHRVQRHGLRRVLDCARCAEPSSGAQRVVRVSVRDRVAQDPAGVAGEQRVEQAHAATMRDALCDPFAVTWQSRDQHGRQRSAMRRSSR